MRWKVFILLSIFLVSFVVADIPEDCDDSMVSYWKLDGDATDSFGTNSGSGGVFSGSILLVNTSSIFSGSQSITILDDNDFSLDSNFAIEMLIRNSPMSTLASVVLFSKGDYNISFNTAGNFLASDGVNSIISGFISGILENYHIALVKDGDILYLYVNGVEQDSMDVSVDVDDIGDIVIGENFEGLIDEVALYNSALSSDTIQSHYFKANAGNDYCSLSGSGAQTDFTIAGCSNGAERVFAGDCSDDGYWFCNEDGGDFSFEDVLKIPNACSFGSVDELGRGEPKCCPSGYACKYNDSTGSICERRTDDCTTFDNSDDCEDEGCYWFGDEETGSCIEDPTEFSCSVYTSNTSCKADIFRLGVNGLEAKDKCSSYFQISDGSYWIYDNCSCGWDSGAEKCELNYLVTCFIGENCGSFECSKDFKIGECVDGNQMVSWDANAVNEKGQFKDDGIGIFNESLYEEVVKESCSDNPGIERSCGSEVIKLPGFSSFSFVMVIGESN